jgi:hypothetical protein
MTQHAHNGHKHTLLEIPGGLDERTPDTALGRRASHVNH